tara:strand:+ start:1947 stop:2174 length:228 start_codon:yes stop_codon:yes gene_type:complete
MHPQILDRKLTVADKVQTQVWLMRETRDALKKVSIKEGVSMAQIVEDALQIVLPQRQTDIEDRIKRMQDLSRSIT